MHSVLFPGTQYPYLIMAICFLAAGVFNGLTKDMDKKSGAFQALSVIFAVPIILSLLFLTEAVLHILRALQILDTIIIK